jgi:phage protein U
MIPVVSQRGEGPTPLMLGAHMFRSTGFSFTGLQRETHTEWSSIDVTGREQALHWTGPKGQDMTIKGALFPVEFGGLATLDRLRADQAAGRVMPLVTGSGHVLGLYVVESVSEDMSHHTGDGSPRKVDYTIKLKRATGGGSGLAGIAAQMLDLFA